MNLENTKIWIGDDQYSFNRILSLLKVILGKKVSFSNYPLDNDDSWIHIMDGNIFFDYTRKSFEETTKKEMFFSDLGFEPNIYEKINRQPIKIGDVFDEGKVVGFKIISNKLHYVLLTNSFTYNNDSLVANFYSQLGLEILPEECWANHLMVTEKVTKTTLSSKADKLRELSKKPLEPDETAVDNQRICVQKYLEMNTLPLNTSFWLKLNRDWWHSALVGIPPVIYTGEDRFYVPPIKETNTLLQIEDDIKLLPNFEKYSLLTI